MELIQLIICANFYEAKKIIIAIILFLKREGLTNNADSLIFFLTFRTLS